MGDERHKKSPPPADQEEDVTEQFRKDVRAMLENNAERNKLRRVSKGEDGYLISNHAELADAIGADKNIIRRLIGGAREGTEVKSIARSTYVIPIIEALKLGAVTRVLVRVDRATVLRTIADLPDDRFKVFEEAVDRELRRAEKR